MKTIDSRLTKKMKLLNSFIEINIRFTVKNVFLTLRAQTSFPVVYKMLWKQIIY